MDLTTKKHLKASRVAASPGISLVVQWLRLRTSTVGAQVQSLVGELKPHMPWGTGKNKRKE